MIDDIEFLDDATRPPLVPLTDVRPDQRHAGQHLREIHDHLRGNMRALGALIERAMQGTVSADDVAKETRDMVMIANYRRFGNLCGQHCQFVEMHHSIEDEAVFPQIARHGDGFRRIADRLRAEHVVVHELLMRLVDALEALAKEPNVARFDAAREVYGALERVLLSHLGYEEDAIGDALGYFRIF